MANFSTHLVGAVSAGVVATSLLAATDLLPLAGVASGVGTVALGGIFPDVDSDYSDSIELVFSLLGVTLAVPLMIAVLPGYGLLASLLALAIAYAAIRYGIIFVFRAVTVHRGVFHSIPMAALLMLLVATVAHAGMGADALTAWLYAGLFLVGFVTHLVLDETYSVDLANRQIKRSFGTAIKLYERDRAWRYVALYAVLLSALFFVPSPESLLEAITDLELRLLPAREAIAILLPR